MKTPAPLPRFINDFEIIKDLGPYLLPSWARKNRAALVRCKKCNNEFIISTDNLKKQKIGCSKKCAKFNGGTKRLRKIYEGMNARCYNPAHVSAKIYFNKGITICDAWLHNPSDFYRWSFDNGYTESLTLDRIDNQLGYSPENCRWTNKDIQSQNSINSKLCIEDVRKILLMLPEVPQNEIALIFGVSKGLINGIARGYRWKNVPRLGVNHVHKDT